MIPKGKEKESVVPGRLKTESGETPHVGIVQEERPPRGNCSRRKAMQDIVERLKKVSLNPRNLETWAKNPKRIIEHLESCNCSYIDGFYYFEGEIVIDGTPIHMKLRTEEGFIQGFATFGDVSVSAIFVVTDPLLNKYECVVEVLEREND